jgi:hypothetical protein
MQRRKKSNKKGTLKMPIVVEGKHVIVFHSNSNIKPFINELDLSDGLGTELALWIASHRLVNNPMSNIKPITKQWEMRAYYAANRCYPEPLAANRMLTREGLRRIQSCTEIANILYDYDPKDTDPNQFTSLEQMVLFGSIPIRAIGLLSALNSATNRTLEKTTTETINKNKTNQETEQGEQGEQNELLKAFGIEEQDWQNTQDSPLMPSSTSSDSTFHGFISVLEFDQIMDGITQGYSGGYVAETMRTVSLPNINQTTDIVGKDVVMVPISSLPKIARTDIKYLARFGLVAVKTLFGFSKGRPPQCIMITQNGVTALHELVRTRQLLPHLGDLVVD